MYHLYTLRHPPTHTFFILNIYGICLRITYDLGMMHIIIQDICLKPYSFLTCLYQPKVNDPVLSLILFTYIFVSYSFYILLFVFTYLCFFFRFTQPCKCWTCTDTASERSTTNSWWVYFTYWTRVHRLKTTKGQPQIFSSD